MRACALHMLLLLQASHFKTDWHRFNLRQAAKGSSVITEEEFQRMMEGLFVRWAVVFDALLT